MLFRHVGKNNARWKAWRRIGRGLGGQFFLEHKEAVLDTLCSSGRPLEILLSEARYQQNASEWDRRASAHPEVAWYLVDAESLDRVVSVPNCSGVVGVYESNESELADLLGMSFLLVGWNLADPGNLGTLLRSVNALTDGGVIFLGGCTPWSSKVARASAGALFRTPICRLGSEDGEGLVKTLASHGYLNLTTFPTGGISPRTVRWQSKNAVFLGNESRGLPPQLRDGTTAVSLAMTAQSESLNVAALGSILCYEWQGAQEESVHG